MGFCYIAGLGRCGTMWLANALDDRNHGVAFHHELANPSVSPLTTVNMWFQERQRTATERGVDVPEFRSYFQFIHNEMGRYRVVGDTLSWLPHLLPAVHRLTNLDKVIVLVRNGMQQMHSLWNYTEWRGYKPPFGLNSPGLVWNYIHLMNKYHLMREQDVDTKWFGTSCWERLCGFWSAYQELPAWLSKKMPSARIYTFRLEDLTQDISKLRSVLRIFDVHMHKGDNQLRALQARDLNRRTQGDRRPATLWSKWSPEQQAAFIEICSPCMEHYGYEMPS